MLAHSPPSAADGNKLKVEANEEKWKQGSEIKTNRNIIVKDLFSIHSQSAIYSGESAPRRPDDGIF